MGSQVLHFFAMTVLLLLVAALFRLSSGAQCGNLTQSGPEGAHFVRYVGSKHRLAPDTELEEREKAVIIRGRVLDRTCSPVPGAVVDIWYSGQARSENMYRGQALTNKLGEFKFLASVPSASRENLIPHYNIKVRTGGDDETTFNTQIYFKDRIPIEFEDFVRKRDTQFASMSKIHPGSGSGQLKNGGRLVQFTMKLNI